MLSIYQLHLHAPAQNEIHCQIVWKYIAASAKSAQNFKSGCKAWLLIHKQILMDHSENANSLEQAAATLALPDKSLHWLGSNAFIRQLYSDVTSRHLPAYLTVPAMRRVRTQMLPKPLWLESRMLAIWPHVRYNHRKLRKYSHFCHSSRSWIACFDFLKRRGKYVCLHTPLQEKMSWHFHVLCLMLFEES